MYQETGILPRALASRPNLEPENLEYLDAFNFLDAARQTYAEGIQPVQVSEVLSYCTLAGIPVGEPALKMLRIVQSLDNARINHWHKKNSKS